jgi:DNA-binding CsgD family transcriptional regulator
MGFRINSNLEKTIKPILNRLETRLDEFGDEDLTLLRDNLENIIAPFTNDLKIQYSNLTSREIEICNLIRNSKSTKEIANILNLSTETVSSHRKSIRKKLNISKYNVKLNTFLKAL